jgi:chemotaxis protein methyltransferase CheR
MPPDINHASLDKARQGIFPLEPMQAFTRNYQRAGGLRSFSDYYSAAYGGALFDRRLRDSITFADHSLATDSVFSETQLVSCRNVLIYFNRPCRTARSAVPRLAVARGFPGDRLEGNAGLLRLCRRFEPVSRPDRIYRKLGERP